jgi:phosphatidylglycerol---prolipoprotein diacylglyceryl transferase
MFPELFRIGPFPIHTYGLLVAVGILAGSWLGEILNRRVGGEKGRYLDLALVTVLGGLLGARLLFILVNLPWYLAHPAEVVMIWKGGLVFYGGLIGGVATFLVSARSFGMPVLRTGDIALVSLTLGHAFGRLGCFAAGCCYGAPTDLPWAVTFTDPACLATAVLGKPVHPTQLYEAAFLFALSGFLLWRFSRRAFDGQVACLYGMLYGAGRFGLEFLRIDPRGSLGPLSTSQWISLAVVAVAAAGYVILGRRSAKSQAPNR